MLRVDSSAGPRLAEMEQNVLERIDEAEEHAWLGEVAGLRESLVHIRKKRGDAVHIAAEPPSEGIGSE